VIEYPFVRRPCGVDLDGSAQLLHGFREGLPALAHTSLQDKNPALPGQDLTKKTEVLGLSAAPLRVCSPINVRENIKWNRDRFTREVQCRSSDQSLGIPKIRYWQVVITDVVTRGLERANPAVPAT
jgi:hypothetical protein